MLHQPISTQRPIILFDDSEDEHQHEEEAAPEMEAETAPSVQNKRLAHRHVDNTYMLGHKINIKKLMAFEVQHKARRHTRDPKAELNGQRLLVKQEFRGLGIRVWRLPHRGNFGGESAGGQESAQKGTSATGGLRRQSNHGSTYDNGGGNAWGGARRHIRVGNIGSENGGTACTVRTQQALHIQRNHLGVTGA